MSQQCDAFDQAFVRPWMHSTITPEVAELIRQAHPGRVTRTMWSERSDPWMALFAPSAAWVQANRTTPAAGSPYPALEAAVAAQVEANLKTWGALRDAWYEMLFQSLVP